MCELLYMWVSRAAAKQEVSLSLSSAQTGDLLTCKRRSRLGFVFSKSIAA